MTSRAVRVLPDVPAIDKPFDYVVPEALADRVAVGTIVRVRLHGRRVRGWVVADDVVPAAGLTLQPLAAVTGLGPAAELFELARWAAWRWAGRTVHFLRTASPPTVVQGLPPPPVLPPPSGGDGGLAGEALDLGRAVLRLPPAADSASVVLEAARRGTTLVVAPSLAMAGDLARRLLSAGVPTALVPRQWAAAAAGARVVVGARSAAWAPAPGLTASVVIDEHDEAHQEESSPTWNARDVVAERARRAGAACVWTSPCPSLEALQWAPLVAPSRAEERAGWPVVDVVDRRREEPIRADLYSPRLVEALRVAAAPRSSGSPGTRMVCVLNRKGRAGLLACSACAELARCEACGSTVAASEGAGSEDAAAEHKELVCRRCSATQRALCASCGGTRLKALRPGVRRAREDLERLSGVAVTEVTGADAGPAPADTGPVVVGTEAVLHRMRSAGLVAFLDLDAELLAPRYRAAEQALTLLVRAARLLGGRRDGGRILLQTRLPSHEVVQAALHADPSRVASVERSRRETLRFPPVTAMALVSGAAAATFVESLSGETGVELLGPADGVWLVRAPDHRTLCDALAASPRPPGRLRVAVDPLRV